MMKQFSSYVITWIEFEAEKGIMLKTDAKK